MGIAALHPSYELFPSVPPALDRFGATHAINFEVIAECSEVRFATLGSGGYGGPIQRGQNAEERQQKGNQRRRSETPIGL
jgi:hypothetical protein